MKLFELEPSAENLKVAEDELFEKHYSNMTISYLFQYKVSAQLFYKGFRYLTKQQEKIVFENLYKRKLTQPQICHLAKISN